MQKISDSDFSPSFSQEFARAIYTLLLHLLVPLALLSLIIKALTRSFDYNQRKRERFGFIAKPERTGGILLHCVSVGEVVAASEIIKAIRSKQPDINVTITTTTPTGSQRVKDIFADTVQHYYLPYDLPWAVARFVRKIRPDTVMIAEVELWPNFIHYCWRKRIPTYIVNGRMTDKSARNYAKFSALFTPMLHKLTGVSAQGQRDFDNYISLGQPQNRLYLSNNIKFDHQLTQQDLDTLGSLRAQLQLDNKKVILGGSTHDPEEQMLINSYLAIKPNCPDLLLVIVPRHPQRFDKVYKLCNKHALSTVRLSQNQAVSDETDVVIADAMGILKASYGLADVTFVGGSFADKGGHNALEAALHCIPSIMGPHIYNNPTIFDALQSVDALHIAHDQATLTQLLRERIQDANLAYSEGKAGKDVVEENAGALQKTLEIIGYA
ncbi:MAG: 3-deoxy-D-manno-octulosonic acid transferase [Alteromonadaceae bacterium]|nr:3-deoxy-D-manno-octulosonic acid transferase [Alteromonadaceae bacterium]